MIYERRGTGGLCRKLDPDKRFAGSPRPCTGRPHPRSRRKLPRCEVTTRFDNGKTPDADLHERDLSAAIPAFADVTYANLSEMDFRRAISRNTNLPYADLRGADPGSHSA
ncbi:pentapeptide repeat-containing protein [Actinokineospora enzanensis]|uniref:pentapeptide repeat-containing protein n=1 Tax=Actinokineospora enzanensis TaxID=155975 RepID=UPI0012EC2C26